MCDQRYEIEYKVAPGNVGKCLVQVWEGKPTIVVITELKDNPGMSITNAIEIVVSQISTMLELWDKPVIWIEHYPEETGYEAEGTFDLITFCQVNNFAGGEIKVRNPGWRPLRKAAVDLLVGHGGYNG